MTELKFDVLGIGNAIVDVVAQVDDSFLETENLDKGMMALIDTNTAQDLYNKLGPAIECSGGSAANTIAGLASLGGRGAYVGKVKNDQLGQIFSHDLRSLGVHFETTPSVDGASTATSIVLVTPDAQRTMNTYLGACVELGPDDIKEAEIAAAKVTYMEGYLWDPKAAQQAFIKAATIAHQAGRQVSLSLSDPFCVDRHREGFLDLVAGHVDILFANEEEIISLYQVASFDEAVQAVRGQCEVAALTRSEKGSVIVTGTETHTIAAAKVNHVVDTTGAGDSFAAGYLFGHTQGFSPDVSAKIAGIAAAEIISHLGARPAVDLKTLITDFIG